MGSPLFICLNKHMTLEEISSYLVEYFEQEVCKGGELEDMLEWFCDEEGYDVNDEESIRTYIERLMDNFKDNLTMVPQWNGSYTLAQSLQDEYDEAVEDLEYDMIDFNEVNEDDYTDALGQILSEKLDNPWANTWGYEWEPICHAFNAIGLTDEKSLAKISGATNGQMLVLAFYILGTDGALPWAWATYCVG